MKIIKKTISSGKITVGDFKVSSTAEVSAFASAGEFVFSLCPVSIIVETESGAYSFDLKRWDDPLQIR